MSKVKPGSTITPKPGVGLNTWLIVGLLFFTVPIVSAALFSVQVGDGTYTLTAYSRMITDPGLSSALWL